MIRVVTTIAALSLFTIAAVRKETCQKVLYPSSIRLPTHACFVSLLIAIGDVRPSNEDQF
jgi:hypothetical protein